MADKKFGQKRVCSSCELKFYDLNKKSPLTCPQCKSEVIIEEESYFMNSIQPIQKEKNTEIKDEFSGIENADDQNDDDEIISLDDAVDEEEESSKN